MFSKRCRREQSHRTGDAAGLIGQDVPERVLGDEYIDEAWAGDQFHGSVVNVHIVSLNFWIFRSHLLGHLPPEPRRLQHIRLVHHRQMLTAKHRQ